LSQVRFLDLSLAYALHSQRTLTRHFKGDPEHLLPAGDPQGIRSRKALLTVPKISPNLHSIFALSRPVYTPPPLVTDVIVRSTE
jgi:hypothetical protein